MGGQLPRRPRLVIRFVAAVVVLDGREHLAGGRELTLHSWAYCWTRKVACSGVIGGLRAWLSCEPPTITKEKAKVNSHPCNGRPATRAAHGWGVHDEAGAARCGTRPVHVMFGPGDQAGTRYWFGRRICRNFSVLMSRNIGVRAAAAPASGSRCRSCSHGSGRRRRWHRRDTADRLAAEEQADHRAAIVQRLAAPVLDHLHEVVDAAVGAPLHHAPAGMRRTARSCR